MAMKQPKYVEAVDWIATNDSHDDDDDLDALKGFISVVMVADLFGVPADVVAGDVLGRRGKGPTRVEIHRQWVAYERRCGNA